MNYRTTREFDREFKKLAKRYKTLASDLAEFKKVLNKSALGIGKHFAVLSKTETIYIVKARLFSKSLKRSSLRIVYAYHSEQAQIEFVGVEFIELFFKGDKTREDQERIKNYLANI